MIIFWNLSLYGKWFFINLPSSGVHEVHEWLKKNLGPSSPVVNNGNVYKPVHSSRKWSYISGNKRRIIIWSDEDASLFMIFHNCETKNHWYPVNPVVGC